MDARIVSCDVIAIPLEMVGQAPLVFCALLTLSVRFYYSNSLSVMASLRSDLNIVAP
jgi:hypothetical protein